MPRSLTEWYEFDVWIAVYRVGVAFTPDCHFTTETAVRTYMCDRFKYDPPDIDAALAHCIKIHLITVEEGLVFLQ